jgi:TetR/AcrR family transcriptional regulator, regulator of cefoperazone and chloramphenicol sensitivity
MSSESQKSADSNVNTAVEPPSGEDARSRILAAAGPVFARSGFERATVREICGEANANVASVGYYFGDKLGLYRQVIRQIHERKERLFPTPVETEADAATLLHSVIRTLLSRIFAGDSSGWESQLMMREMMQPTPVFAELVQESFRPLFARLVETFRRLVTIEVSEHELEQFAFSVVGQCVYYRIGSGVIQILVPESSRQHYDIDSLSRHVTGVMLAAAESGRGIQYKQSLCVNPSNLTPFNTLPR